VALPPWQLQADVLFSAHVEELFVVLVCCQLQVLYGMTVADVMLFDEVAESLLGVPASQMKSELLGKYPSLPQLLDELLVGLRVSFSFLRPAPKRSAT
jgi:hypothetical protein